MENLNEQQNEEQQNELWKDLEKEHKRGKILGGILVVAIGAVFLAKELGADIPVWLFTWKMLLIALGFIGLVKHKFQSTGGLIAILVGGAFLMADLYPGLLIRPLLLPVIIIAVGLFIIFKPQSHFKRKHHWKKWAKHHHRYDDKRWKKHYFDDGETEIISDDDHINSVTRLGALKKSIMSKTFKGGKIKISFGGVKLNLSQADFEGQVILEIDQSFSGLQLIVPAHWNIRSELVTGFSSVEDNRTVQPVLGNDTEKTLILKGDVYFGGIEITNY